MQMLVNCANAILRRCHSDSNTLPPTVGTHWARRYLDAHPEFYIRKQKSFDVDRKNSHNPVDIQDWFRRYHQVVSTNNITPGDIYNFDETGFRIVVGKNQLIITLDPTRPSYLASSNN